MPRRAQDSSARRRPHRVPPPITHGGETLEAVAILHEIPNDSGLMLWKTVRSVQLWATLSADERPGAFKPDSYADRIRDLLSVSLEVALVEPAIVAAGVLKGSADPASVAGACRSVAGWASESGHVGTALAFAQAAALTQPQVAEHSLEVGRLARLNGEHGRAESWFRHSIAVSRRQRAGDQFCWSYIGLGNLLLQRGNLPAAGRCMLRAARAAKRHSLRELQAMAHHGLAEVGIHAERDRDVFLHARLAQELYPAGHERVSALAHDVAYYWVTRGHFAAALRVLLALRARFTEPAERLCLAGSIARAAGGVGSVEIYREAACTARELLRNARTGNYAAGTLLDLARGALGLADHDSAESLAREAQVIAQERAEGQIRMEVEALLQEIADARTAGSAAERSPKTPRRVEVLADQFASSLAVCV